MSADGRYVAFQSAAGNLAPDDTNRLHDVFLRDVVTGITWLASRERNGWTAPGRASIAPLLSTNGRWVVYESAAANLVDNDTNNATDIFVYDRLTESNVLVSVNGSGNGSRAGGSQSAHITPDGRFVAFLNYSSNTTPAVSHVFVRDLQLGSTLWASFSAAGLLSDYRGAAHPVLSADGSKVFFHAYNGVTTNLYHVTVTDGTTALVNEFTSRLSAPSPSANGRFVAFESNRVVHIADTVSSNTIPASVTLAGDAAPSGEKISYPILSAAGTRVCFVSSAGGLTSDPTNGLAQLYQRDLTAGATLLLSGDPSGAASGDFSSGGLAISADATMVAFESTSTTMVADDLNSAPDVFVRDFAASMTELISRRDPPRLSFSGTAASTLFTNVVSADGRYVAFGSFDRLGIADDTNGALDGFVLDRMTGTIELVTRGATTPPFNDPYNIREFVLSAGGRHVAWVSGSSVGAGSSVYWRDLAADETRAVTPFADFNSGPAISPEGRWVAFHTARAASTFEPGITEGNGGYDIVLQDVPAGTNVVISRSHLAFRTGNGNSTGPQFSPDGRWLAFVSVATDLTTNVTGAQQLYLRDLASSTLLSPSALVTNGYGYASGARFSGNSRYLTFATLLNQIVVFDLFARTGVVVRASNARNPVITADGRYVAMEEISPRRIVLLDRQLGSVTPLGDPSLDSFRPILTADGRYLVFLSRSRPGASVHLPANLFVHNLARGTTLPLTPSLNSENGNGPTYQVELAADDRTLVFASFASDLMLGDYNDRRDVFLLRLGGPDTDSDGLDDDFEVAYFGNLLRDGQGDLDGDGHNDRAEFLAGTDPTNEGSVLRVLTVTSLDGNAATVIWESVAGRHYVVQFKDELSASWSTLPGLVTAHSTTAARVDSSSPRPNTRFYRVMLAPQ